MTTFQDFKVRTTAYSQHTLKQIVGQSLLVYLNMK